MKTYKLYSFIKFCFTVLFFSLIILNCQDDLSSIDKPDNVPQVITSDARNITQTTVIIGGKITDELEFVTAMGVCYDTVDLPTISSLYSPGILNTDSFTINIKYLKINKTYYARAYAQNELGIGYGQQIVFTTLPPQIPHILTNKAEHIRQTEATLFMTVLSDSGSAITNKGFCWSLKPNPTLDNSVCYVSEGFHYFNYKMTNLFIDTMYYVKAFAINSVGIAYGSEIAFKTLPADGLKVYDNEGHLYTTMTLGEQVWLGQNLKSTIFNDGTPIARISDNKEWSTTSQPAYTYYNNDESKVFYYGALYNAYVIKEDNICPTGWHVPDVKDFKVFGEYGASVGLSPFGLGFEYKSSGCRYPDGTFDNISDSAANMSTWWSSTQTNNLNGAQPEEFSFSYQNSNNNGFSIRCIRDEQSQVPESN